MSWFRGGTSSGVISGDDPLAAPFYQKSIGRATFLVLTSYGEARGLEAKELAAKVRIFAKLG